VASIGPRDTATDQQRRPFGVERGVTAFWAHGFIAFSVSSCRAPHQTAALLIGAVSARPNRGTPAAALPCEVPTAGVPTIINCFRARPPSWLRRRLLHLAGAAGRVCTGCSVSVAAGAGVGGSAAASSPSNAVTSASVRALAFALPACRCRLQWRICSIFCPSSHHLFHFRADIRFGHAALRQEQATLVLEPEQSSAE